MDKRNNYKPMRNKITHLLHSYLTPCVIGLVMLFNTPAQAVNYGVPTVVAHELNCGDVFVCPAELQGRIDFWIQVFRLWELEDRIFHDSRVPERVYSVVNSKDRCSRKKPKGEVKLEYNRIKVELLSLADRLEQGQDPASIKGSRLLSLFDKPTAAELRDAADNVRCQSGNRERFQGALENFQRYRPFILQVLQDNGLSEDIQYLPFVESAYNPKAYSYAGAAGLWQIMPRTARSLGLQVGSAVDERFEPEMATLAAAKYFTNSTRKLSKAAISGGHSTEQAHINPFIITSYNYGVRGMERAIAQVGSDYVKLLAEYKSNSFRTAVRNFYASFLAARYVAQNASFYFPSIQHNTAPATNSIPLKKAVSAKQVESIFKVKRKQLKTLNPALTSKVWRGSRLIPAGYVLKVPENSRGWDRQIAKLAKLPAPAGSDSGNRHKVRRGQTACGIAEKYGARCRDLIVLNKLNRKAVIRIGQRLKIPSTGKEKYKPSALAQQTASVRQSLVAGTSQKNVQSDALKDSIAANSSTPSKQTQASSKPATKTEPSIQFDMSVQQNGQKHWVKILPSETVGHYADWLGKGSSADIRRLNGMRKNTPLRIGKRVNLPIKTIAQKEAFEAQRSDYHEAISAQYFERYEVVKTYPYRIRSGQTLWRISQNAGVPLWLIYNYNPRTNLALAGKRITLPEVKQKGS